MWSTLGLFKILTNFSLLEFDELCRLMVPTIQAHTKGYWWDSHNGLATDQTNFGTTIVPIHLIHETWQYCHVWHIPLELDQICYMQWCSFHCILHQFNIQQWDLIVEPSKTNDSWYIDPRVPRLYLIHWWDIHQDLKTLE